MFLVMIMIMTTTTTTTKTTATMVMMTTTRRGGDEGWRRQQWRWSWRSGLKTLIMRTTTALLLQPVYVCYSDTGHSRADSPRSFSRNASARDQIFLPTKPVNDSLFQIKYTVCDEQVHRDSNQRVYQRDAQDPAEESARTTHVWIACSDLIRRLGSPCGRHNSLWVQCLTIRWRQNVLLLRKWHQEALPRCEAKCNLWQS